MLCQAKLQPEPGIPKNHSRALRTRFTHASRSQGVRERLHLSCLVCTPLNSYGVVIVTTIPSLRNAETLLSNLTARLLLPHTPHFKAFLFVYIRSIYASLTTSYTPPHPAIDREDGLIYASYKIYYLYTRLRIMLSLLNILIP